jgi:hypothetical protein
LEKINVEAGNWLCNRGHIKGFTKKTQCGTQVR